MNDMKYFPLIDGYFDNDYYQQNGIDVVRVGTILSPFVITLVDVVVIMKVYVVYGFESDYKINYKYCKQNITMSIYLR